MSDKIRSVAFNIYFYVWSACVCTLLLPTLLTRRTAIFTDQVWVRGTYWGLKHIMNLDLDLKGHLHPNPVIYASKHQSAWETVMMRYIIPNPAIVLKQELMWIPLFGWFLARCGQIPITRSKTNALNDLKTMLRSASKAVERDQPVFIFPEGTRSAPDKAGTYHSGIASLYTHLKVPVVPIAHNSGCFWPRRGFFKRSGTVRVRFLEPIPPGLPRKEFMERLESAIEGETRKLVKGAYTQ